MPPSDDGTRALCRPVAIFVRGRFSSAGGQQPGAAFMLRITDARSEEWANREIQPNPRAGSAEGDISQVEQRD